MLRKDTSIAEVRPYESEFVDVTFSEVPPRFPDSVIKNVLSGHGETNTRTTIEKDRFNKIFSGIRKYSIKQEELKENPLP